MSGPPPTPTVLKLIRGNPGKRPINKKEPRPKPAPKNFQPPEWLTETQKAEWKYLVDNSAPGLLTYVDRGTLLTYVVAADQHRISSEQVARFGAIVRRRGAVKEDGTREPDGEPYQNPHLSVVNRQAQIMLKAAAELGFTPASRSRVKVDGPGLGAEPDSPWSKFG